jgi:OmpA-OmpF porin, OOP family
MLSGIKQRFLIGLSMTAIIASDFAAAQQSPLNEAPRMGDQAWRSPAQISPSDDRPLVPAQQDAPRAAPSMNDIIRSLAPFADGNPNAPRRQTRDVDAEDGKRRIRVDYSRKIDITVFFDYDSAQLTADARNQLEPLARALQSKELLPHQFLIAGHTDATGDPGYNRRLSLQRALAVRGYLAETHGIEPSRLVVHGWGQARLRNPREPHSGVNRRVEVALIEPSRPTSSLEYPFHSDWRATRRQVTGQAPRCHIRGQLVDPRSKLWSDDLDDFHATPTGLSCGYTHWIHSAPIRRDAWHDFRAGTWREITE